MQQSGIDRLARALARVGPRRRVIAAVGLALAGLGANPSAGRQRRRRSGASILDRRRKRAERRAARNRKGKGKGKGNEHSRDRRKRKEAFPKDCRRFVLTADPDPNMRLRHVDDDVLIELIPRGNKSNTKVLLEDDNDSPNGPGGLHLRADPFTARVGDRIHIVARNEAPGGCELDEIWIHCLDGGGKAKLSSAVTPEECEGNANRIGVFFDETFRIRNKRK